MDYTMRISCLLFLSFFSLLELNAQNKAKDKKMESCGTCAVSGSMTLEDAKKCAREKAMEEALNRAGVSLDVRSNQQLHQSEINSGFSESFVRAVSTEFRGGIVQTEKLSEDIRLNELGFPEVVYCMRSAVRLYTTLADPGFTHHISGLQSAYPKEARLNFSVEGPGSYMLGYFIEGDSIHSFYPNSREAMRHLPANETVTFPFPESQTEYWILNERKDAPKAVLLVFLKEPLRPPSVQLVQEFLLWLQGIEPSARQVILRPVVMGN
jgi:hypothetical protein